MRRWSWCDIIFILLQVNPMPNNLETKEHCFFVQPTDHGTYVTDKVTGQRYFLTKNGGCFLLRGPNSPFDEDAIVPKKTAEYLSSVVKTARMSHQE